MKIIVGISGASGAILGVEMLKALNACDVETHLVISKGAQRTLRDEAGLDPHEVENMAYRSYDDANLGAVISSGSFRADGMIVAPCSMKSLSAIVHAYDANLLVRAADVCLKESRRVVLLPREMPFNKTHLRNLLRAAEDGCHILVPCLTFYNHPVTIEEQITHIVGKTLGLFGLTVEGFKPWAGQERA